MTAHADGQDAGSLVAELGRASGLPGLALNGQGVCAVESDGLQVVIEAPRGGVNIYFYTKLLPLPENGRAALCEAMLAMNFCCQQSGGATLALDPARKAACLCLAVPLAGLEFLSFQNIFGNFLSAASRCSQELEQFVARQAGDAPPPATDQFFMPGMRV